MSLSLPMLHCCALALRDKHRWLMLQCFAMPALCERYTFNFQV